MICMFHEWENIGLYYKPILLMGWNYDIQLIDVYRCSRCGRKQSIVAKNHDNYFHALCKQKPKGFNNIKVKNFYSE